MNQLDARLGRGGKATKTVTCESGLREAGVDEAFVAKKLKEQLEAKQRRWSPKKQDYELFPDNDARLAALRVAIKIFGGYPSENEGDGGGVIYYLCALKPGLKDDGHIFYRADSNGDEVPAEGPANPADATAEVICASALRRVGVDKAFIAKKLKELLEAKQPQWNPKKKEYELVADDDARLAGIKEVVKIFGSYPSDEKGPVDIHMGWMTRRSIAMPVMNG